MKSVMYILLFFNPSVAHVNKSRQMKFITFCTVRKNVLFIAATLSLVKRSGIFIHDYYGLANVVIKCLKYIKEMNKIKCNFLSFEFRM